MRLECRAVLAQNFLVIEFDDNFTEDRAIVNDNFIDLITVFDHFALKSNAFFVVKPDDIQEIADSVYICLSALYQLLKDRGYLLYKTCVSRNYKHLNAGQ